MGNYQFGLSNRPPDFIGKGWLLLKDRKKSNTDRKNKLLSPNMVNQSARSKRCGPNVRSNSFRGRYSDAAPVAFQEDIDENEQFGPGSAQFGGTPKPMKQRSGVRRTRSMRCSPTVPDSVTLTMETVNNVVIGAGGIAAAAAGSASSEAVASALNALHRLSPAAPRMFKEPSFDDFFEEAERRNQTMEALRAALGGRSQSTASFGHHGITLAPLERASSFNAADKTPHTRGNILSEGDRRSRASPIIVQPPTPPRKLSPVPSSGSVRRKDSWTKQADSEVDSLLGNKDGDQFTSHSSKGHVLVIVGGCSDAESLDGEGWDRPPPTIIVQPERDSEFASSPACSSSSCLPSVGVARSTCNSQMERRRSVNPTGFPLLNPGLGVRFADELISPPPVLDADGDENQKREYEKSLQRVRCRSSIRRKTIGVVTNIYSLEQKNKADLHTCTRPLDDTAAGVPLFMAQTAQQQRQARSVAKKSFSRSDLVPPPVISLLTQPQMILIRHLWQQIYVSKGPTVLGSHIFHRVMFKNPHIREVFRIVDIGNHGFNVDLMCKKHAKSVASVLDDLVRNLDNLEAVEDKLTDVGRQHAIFHDLGFHINFWSVFAEAFIDCTLEWGEKNRRVEEARKAWAIIISYVTDKLKLGYQEARRNMPRSCTGRRIRVVSETEIRAPASDTIPTLPLIRSDSH